MKRRFFITLIFSLCLILSSCTNTPSSPNASEQNFSEFADSVFKDFVSSDSITLNYSLKNPSAYDIYPSKASYGTDEAPESSANDYYEDILSSLNSFSYNTLTSDEQLIYDTLTFILEARTKLNELYLLSEPLTPYGGIQSELPLLLSEYKFYSKNDIYTYLDLLNSFYEYFETLAEFSTEKSQAGLFMNSNAAASVIEECTSFAASFKTAENFLTDSFIRRLNEMNSISEVEYATFIKLHDTAINTSVIPAYEMLANTLTKLLSTCSPEHGIGAFKNGKDFFKAYATFKTGSSKSIDEMNSLLENMLNKNLETMTSIYEQHPDVIKKCTTFTFPSVTASDATALLSTEMLSVFPAFPDTSKKGEISCEIKYVPDSLSTYLSPAMYLVPPIDDFCNNTVYINPIYNSSQFFPTIAHETYPGHLYQHVYFNLLSPHPLRNVLSVTGWEEGWATYAEACSYYLCGLETYVADYLVASHYILHALYSLSDIGIHYYDWDVTATIAFWEDYGIDAAVSRDLFSTIAASPCLYLPYGVGCAELLELKELYFEAFTAAALKDFHTFILETGPVPFESIKKRIIK